MSRLQEKLYPNQNETAGDFEVEKERERSASEETGSKCSV
jgi:hypothetical protein